MEGEGAWGNVSWCEDGQSRGGEWRNATRASIVSEVVESPFIAIRPCKECVE